MKNVTAVEINKCHQLKTVELPLTDLRLVNCFYQIDVNFCQLINLQYLDISRCLNTELNFSALNKLQTLRIVESRSLSQLSLSDSLQRLELKFLNTSL